MGYCFITTEKFKSLGTLTSKHMHNYQKVTVKKMLIQIWPLLTKVRKLLYQRL